MGVLYLNEFVENIVINRSYVIIPFRYIELLIFGKSNQKRQSLKLF